MTRAMLTCGCAALALAACSKKADTAATGTPATTTAAAPATPSPMSAPSRRTGLWEQTMTLAKTGEAGRSFAHTSRMCVDEASEAKMKWWSTEGRAKSGCAEQSVTPRLGGGWSFHSVCAMGNGASVTADGAATGDFGSHYSVNVTSVTSGSPMPQANGTHAMTIEASWKGPCPAGMKGGDVEAGGRTFNILNDSAGAPAMGRPGHPPTQAEIAQMRAQAQEMVKQMKAQQEGAK